MFEPRENAVVHNILLYMKKAMCNIHPLCLCRRHTDLPFDVKAQTRIPKEFADPEILEGFLPTMSVSSYLYVRTQESLRLLAIPIL